MKLAIIFFIYTLLIMSCHSETNRPIDKDLLTEKEVMEFIRSYDRSWALRDTTLMKELIDDEYVYFSSDGHTRRRADIIGWFNPDDKYKVDTAFRTEIAVMKLNANTAIVSTRWIGSGSFGTEKFDDDQRCGLVIQKLDGKLTLVSEHCVQIVR